MDLLPMTGRPYHDLRQPLNVAMLSCANLRSRILPVLTGADAAYFDSKVTRIEQQISRMSQLLDGAFAPEAKPLAMTQPNRSQEPGQCME